MKFRLFALVAILTACAHAAGTVQQSLQALGTTGNYALTFYWTGDATNGTVPVTVAQGLPTSSQGYRILQIETIPGSPAPTAGYSVQILDSFGGDMMGGAVSGLSASAVQFFSATSATPPIVGSFSLQISGNSVAGAQGRVVVYFGPTTLVNATAGAPGPQGPKGDPGPPGPPSGGLQASAYAWTQTPGGTLSAGVSASVTLTPCPAGVSGSATSLPVYISGGVGTAESVVISGGTCTSGASSGTIVFTPANNHSGAWTVGSATAGIEEAFQVLKAAGKGGVIQLGAGVFNLCGKVTVDADGITIVGAGSTGTGPIYSGVGSGGVLTGYGAQGTLIQPCAANQTLFYVPNGYGYDSGPAKLSMWNIGFSNNGLAGITAINLVRDSAGIFENLNFLGTTNTFYAIVADRVWGTEIHHVMSTGTAVGLFGSTVDSVGDSFSFGYGYVNISDWKYVGATVPNTPIIHFVRCGGCRITDSHFIDVWLNLQGVAIKVSNDSQGCSIQNVFIEGFKTGVWAAATSVGSTAAAPNTLLVSNSQFDCAWGTGCDTIAWDQVLIDPGAIEVTVQGSAFSSPTHSGHAVRMGGTAPGIGNTVAKLLGNSFALTTPAAEVWFQGPSGGGALIANNTFGVNAGGSAMFFSGAGTIPNVVVTGNSFVGSDDGPIVVAAGTTLSPSYVANNFCATDSINTCNGDYAPKIAGTTPTITAASLPPCNSTYAGSRAVVSDSSTAIWGATITGGGSNKVGAFCNGTSWTVYAK